MSRRSQPTARQRRLGAELRRLRETAGLGAQQAAGPLGVDAAELTRIEAGTVAVRGETVRALAARCGAQDEQLVRALAAMADEPARGWWQAYHELLPQGFLDLAELEHHASSIRTVEVTRIPALLQTEAHARAVFEHGLTSQLPQRDLDARVAHRMERRDSFHQHQSAPLEAVIHEAALRIRVADRAVARDQLQVLLEASEHDHITIRVIPFDADSVAAAGYAALYAGGPVPPLDTVQLDTVHGGVLLDDPRQLTDYRDFLTLARSQSLDPEDSRALLHKVAQEL